MAKRDKKKIIRVAVIGGDQYFKKMLASLPDFLLLKKRNGNLMIGGSDPNLPNVSKEMWEAIVPKARRGNPFGLPMIVGAGSELSRAEYYKHIWDNEEKLNGVFVPMFGIDPYAFDKEAQGSFSGPYLMTPDEAYEKMIDAVKIPVDRFGEKLDEKLSKR